MSVASGLRPVGVVSNLKANIAKKLLRLCSAVLSLVCLLYCEILMSSKGTGLCKWLLSHCKLIWEGHMGRHMERCRGRRRRDRDAKTKAQEKPTELPLVFFIP